MPSGTDTPLPTADLSLRSPVGTVGVILPDRHALFFAAQLSGAALATGCPVVLKAGPLTPLAVAKLVELAASAAWPPGSLNLIYGTNRELGKKLAADARVVLLALAGPAREREALGAVRAGRPFLSVGGGFGCAILDRTAQIPATVERLLSLRFRRPVLGRTPPYFILSPQDLSNRLLEALISGVSKLTGDDMNDDSAEVPWQVSDALAQRAEDWLAAIRQAGGIIAQGGRRSGTFVEPTVVIAPAGYRRIAPPPEDAPVFVIDSYDKQLLRHLDRIPALEQASVFAGDLTSALELAKLPDVTRVDVYTTLGGHAGSGDSEQDAERLRRVMSEMTRRKWVEVHAAG
jgi:acyl-CoA reductase-like NAD-dependent aldehyde dehydrogenase